MYESFSLVCLFLTNKQYKRHTIAYRMKQKIFATIRFFSPRKSNQFFITLKLGCYCKIPPLCENEHMYSTSIGNFVICLSTYSMFLQTFNSNVSFFVWYCAFRWMAYTSMTIPISNWYFL